MYPDHPEAKKLGCQCWVHPANNKGDGTVVDGVRMYIVNPYCAIHCDPYWWMRKPQMPQH